MGVMMRVKFTTSACPGMSLMGKMVSALDAVDHRSSAEEQQRLEEGMCYQMEHPGGVTPQSYCCYHKAELTDRTVGQHFLVISLSRVNKSRHNPCFCADAR